jgi:PqqD family protein of HPr-rel-A system
MQMKTMIARADTLSTQSVGDELLILDQGAGKIHQLNETAALIWRKCEAGLSAEEVAQALAESYDIGEEAATKDVAATLEKLQALDLICIAK